MGGERRWIAILQGTPRIPALYRPLEGAERSPSRCRLDAIRDSGSVARESPLRDQRAGVGAVGPLCWTHWPARPSIRSWQGRSNTGLIYLHLSPGREAGLACLLLNSG